MNNAGTQAPIPLAAGWNSSMFTDKERCLALVCPVCAGVVRDCVQLTCGHLVCDGCAPAVFRGQVQGACPVDGALINAKDTVPNGTARVTVQQLKVRCWTGPECKWNGTLEQLKEHVANCPFKITPCRYAVYGCKVTVAAQSMSAHMKDAALEHADLLEVRVSRNSAMIRGLQDVNEQQSNVIRKMDAAINSLTSRLMPHGLQLVVSQF